MQLRVRAGCKPALCNLGWLQGGMTGLVVVVLLVCPHRFTGAMLLAR